MFEEQAGVDYRPSLNFHTYSVQHRGIHVCVCVCVCVCGHAKQCAIL